MRLMLTIAAVFALAGCGAGGADIPSPTPSPTHAAVKLDEYARQACVHLDDAVSKRNAGDDPGANIDEDQASIDAAQSQAPGLREIAVKYDESGLDFDKAAPHLRAWCYANATP
jgi:hypothetical protein